MLTKSRRRPASRPRSLGYVVCISNEGYEVSLEHRKLYEALADADAQKNGQLRIVDESGDDYLYPARFFATVRLPQAVSRALREAV